LRVPPRSSGGRRLRIPGKGIFGRGGKRGDLFVKIQVALPAEADAELEAAVRAWRERHGRRAS
jgi:DnaJ-class molecular chaperone